ncbi:MAG: 3'-5' exonuclease [Campylobacterota bacterium]|nr:3'-5' exonuclease [Campylobacterota bacterium]
MIRDFTGNDYEEILEEVLIKILANGSTSLNQIVNFFRLLDSPKVELPELQSDYSINNRTIHIIKTSRELEDAIKSMKTTPFIGFDSEQKPTFKKGEKSHGISVIQLASQSDCYIIQIKQISNIKPILSLLEDDKIIKVGTGLKGDKDELYKQFKIRLKSTIDLEEILNKLSAKQNIGAKKSASIFLNKNLQKSKRMSRSNWENKSLTDGQIKYAAEDATVVYDLLTTIINEYPFIIKVMPKFFKL